MTRLPRQSGSPILQWYRNLFLISIPAVTTDLPSREALVAFWLWHPFLLCLRSLHQWTLTYKVFMFSPRGFWALVIETWKWKLSSIISVLLKGVRPTLPTIHIYNKSLCNFFATFSQEITFRIIPNLTLSKICVENANLFSSFLTPQQSTQKITEISKKGISPHQQASNHFCNWTPVGCPLIPFRSDIIFWR